ncbi:MAG: helix-turn-helix domain-containing protein [Treponema sp.]|jgi:DNA-binding XRE family transcriptional regulator|nr:helix-turn-helix domain-containing protein [Treponema sp.]
MNNFVGDRLKIVRNGLNMRNQSQFAEILGVTQTTLSKYEKGTSDIPDEIKIKLSTFGINLHWLLTGEGAIFIEGKNQFHQELTGNGVVGVAINAGGHIENTGNPYVTVLSDPGRPDGKDYLGFYRIPLLTKEQVFRFNPAKEIPDPNAHSGDYPDYMLAPIPMRLREYGTDLRAMAVFNSLMSPLLNAGDAVIFQATGWNGDGVYVYRMRHELHISHVQFNGREYILTKEFKREEEIPYHVESFDPIGRIRAVLKEL